MKIADYHPQSDMIYILGLEQFQIISSDQMIERTGGTDQILSQDLFEQFLW